MIGFLEIQTRNFGESIAGFIEYVKQAFVDFRLADAIDILLLTVLFYMVVKFLHSRKAGALILGICICLAVFILATLFDMRGMQSLLSSIFQIGALALVIIFQPELRELFTQVGSGSLKGIRRFSDQSRKKQQQYMVVDNICNAAKVLSAEKTGALIAIERTTGLSDVLRTGTAINADVTDSLIRNIFYDKAPLHDGAVVISDNRIAAAACILPLPKRTSVDANLGTRHRAAVGLSEISDAIIIVVSEETGVISVANECELTRGFTVDTLRKYLAKELIKNYREDSSDKNKQEDSKDVNP